MNVVVLVIAGLVVLFFLAIAIGLIIYFVTRKSSPNNGLTDLNKPNGGGPVNPPVSQTCICRFLDEPFRQPQRILVNDCIPFGSCESGTTQ